MYVENGWLSLNPIYLSLLHPYEFSDNYATWMDLKMADTSERRVFCNTILLKYHASPGLFYYYLPGFFLILSSDEKEGCGIYERKQI